MERRAPHHHVFSPFCHPFLFFRSLLQFPPCVYIFNSLRRPTGATVGLLGVRTQGESWREWERSIWKMYCPRLLCFSNGKLPVHLLNMFLFPTLLRTFNWFICSVCYHKKKKSMFVVVFISLRTALFRYPPCLSMADADLYRGYAWMPARGHSASVTVC